MVGIQAPEIILADHYDAKVDLWSVGVILFGEHYPLYRAVVVDTV